MNKEGKFILLIVGVVIIALVAGFFLLQNQQKNAPKVAVDNLEALNRETPLVKGKVDSQIVITEFADLQCPACAAIQPGVESLIAEYGNEIKFVFRHFPLSIHPNAKDAAYAAEAAGEQGKFFEMVHELYARQTEWSNQPDPGPVFSEVAQGLGLNMDEFGKAYSSQSQKARVAQDQADGEALGVNATPTFFFNDEQITYGGLNEVRSKIEAALNPENPDQPTE